MLSFLVGKELHQICVWRAFCKEEQYQTVATTISSFANRFQLYVWGFPVCWQTCIRYLCSLLVLFSKHLDYRQLQIQHVGVLSGTANMHKFHM